MYYIIIAIVAIVLIYIISIYNKLVKSKHIVEEAFSTMDVYLKKRWDLVPNLVEVVKGYANHEKEIIENVTHLRANTYKNLSLNSKIDINNKLDDSVTKIMAISENYPELKANENFLELSRELTKIENDIENSRKYYNGSVRIFNTNILVFPNNIVAKIFGFKEVEMFVAKSEEKNNIKVDL